MKFDPRKVHAFFSRCLYMFLLDGTTKAYGVILESTVKSFQSQYALVGPIFSLQLGVGYIVAPFGNLLDDVLPRRVVAVLGGILVTAGFIGRAFILDSSLWYLLMFMIISGIGFGLVNFVTILGMMDSFREEFPSVYTASSFSGYIGVAALPPILGYMVTAYGEQVGILALGILPSVLLLSGFFTSSKEESLETPGDVPLSKTGDDGKTDETGRLIKEPMDCGYIPGNSFDYWLTIFTNHRAYICLVLISFISSFQYISWSIFLVPYGENLGLNSTDAVYLSTSGGVAGLLGKAFGMVIFRWESSVIPAGLIMPTVLLGVAYGISLFSADYAILILVAFLSGFSLSVVSCVCSAWYPKIVCPGHFKGAVSLGYFIGGVATILGGIPTGIIVDVTGHYRPAFALMALLSFIASMISVFWFLFIKKRSSRVIDSNS